MPVSLNNTVIVKIPATSSTNEIRTAKSTIEMVNAALIELHSSKGTSLKGIYKYIMTNYNLHAITKSRKSLIKKYIMDLKASEDLANKTGKGLVGYLKLKDKKKFIGKLKNEENQKKEQRSKKAAERKSTSAAAIKSIKNTSQKAPTTSKGNANKKKVVKRKIKKPKIPLNQPKPVVPIQTTPVRNNHGVNRSVFDTPMLPSQVHASTPFVQSQVIPQAPNIRGKTNRKRVLNPKNCEVSDTPRSSLPGKKRKIQERGE